MIFENNIYYNNYGIDLNLPSNNNIFYQNNFISNGLNAWDENKNSNNWDNGKKGNYWSNYQNRYPNAKIIWLKGIWNTPYRIRPYEEDYDKYPLIKPHVISKRKTVKNVYIAFLEKNYSFLILKQILGLLTLTN